MKLLNLLSIGCQITSRYEIRNGLIVSYDSAGVMKNIGGDEFYVHNKDFTSAGFVTDLQNGSYSVLMTTKFDDFVLIPQYSCGMGALFPPMKKDWDGPGTQDLKPFHFTFETPPFPILYGPNKIIPIVFDKATYAFGDSLMEQFVGKLLGKHFKKVQSALSQSTMFHRFLLPILLFVPLNASTLIVNSGVWDVLEEIHKSWDDHLKAVDYLLTQLTSLLPNTVIVWKSMTAMHVHNCDCSENRACQNRIKYMSTSRAFKLFTLQRNVVEKHEGVVFMDHYYDTFVSPHESRKRDGRHYTTRFNAKLRRKFISISN